jgi:hypothetical protein
MNWWLAFLTAAIVGVALVALNINVVSDVGFLMIGAAAGGSLHKLLEA